jgi:hypothetical protein
MTTAVAIAALMGGLPVIFGGDRRRILIVFAAAGLGATLLALTRLVSLTWWAVGALGAEYGVFIFGHHAVDFRAPIVASALFVLAESILWRHEMRAGEDNELYIRRLGDVGMIAVGSMGVGTVVLLAGGLAERGNVVLTVLGLVGSVATLVLIAVLVTRAPSGESRQPPNGEADGSEVAANGARGDRRAAAASHVRRVRGE